MEPKPFDGWAVYRPDEVLMLTTMRLTESDAINAYEGPRNTPWDAAERQGYRCLPVTITPREVKP